MRGEYPSLSVTCRLTLGSPPHTRGVSFLLSTSSRPLRITPAYAGSMVFKKLLRHFCGKYSGMGTNSTSVSGSPPLARGIQSFSLPFLTSFWDHPRLRGEYTYSPVDGFAPRGSPPLARGILLIFDFGERRHGITLACAGNTRSRMMTNMAYRDHPRLRGEYLKKNYGFAGKRGSPPLARGILLDCVRQRNPDGITPACAGNTQYPSPPDKRFWDHPRLRGEYSFPNRLALWITGSPPLARGIQVILDEDDYSKGITPACAGNTPLRLDQAIRSWDHPRLRGEYV